MEAFISTELSIPVLQVILLLSFSTLALLMGRLKLALFMNYAFTLYWGYVAHVDLFYEGGTISNFAYLYIGFGIVILLLATGGLITHGD